MATAAVPAEQGQLTKPASDRELVAVIADKQAPLGLRINKMQAFLEKNKAAIFQALPRHLTPDRMMRVMLTNFRRVPKLLDCTPESLFASVTQAASLGLETDGILGQAYLVPFGDECTLIPGYKGLITLCRRSRQISTFDVQSVRKGDQFAYQLGDNPFVRHVPNEEDPNRDEKPITHVYAVAKMRDGGIQRQVWSFNRIESHKKRFSKDWAYKEKSGKKNSTWHTNWEAMAHKTVLRALCKLLPMSPEAMELLARDEAIEADWKPVGDTPAMLSIGELDAHLGGPAIEAPAATHDDPPAESEASGETLDSIELELRAATEALSTITMIRQVDQHVTDTLDRLGVTAEGCPEFLAAAERRKVEIAGTRGGKAKQGTLVDSGDGVGQ